MIYCDASVDDTVIWSGIPCLNGVVINHSTYLGFVGSLFFVDSMGNLDPYYTGFVDRFILFYLPQDAPPPEQVPLQAVPSQVLTVVLGGQNCTLSFYEKAST